MKQKKYQEKNNNQNKASKHFEDNSEIIALKSQVEDYKNKYLRALADYQNSEKRHQAQLSAQTAYGVETVIRELLPFTDSLEKAGFFIKDPGLSLAWKQLTDILTKYGVEKIDPAGQEFDPQYMECIDTATGNENIVIKVYEAGYKLKDKLIRPAKVQVGKIIEN